MSDSLTRMAPLLPLVRALSDALSDGQLQLIQAAVQQPDSLPGLAARMVKELTGSGKGEEASVFLRCQFCGRPQEQFVQK